MEQCERGRKFDARMIEYGRLCAGIEWEEV